MTHSQAAPNNFWPLLDAACLGELTDRQQAELEAHLNGSPDARRIFLEHIQLCTHIRLWHRGVRSREAGLARIEALQKEEHVGHDATERSFYESEACDEVALAPPIVLDLSPGPQTPSVFAPGGMLFSYGVAALVLAVGLLIGWVRQVARYDDLAQTDAAPSVNAPSATARTEVGPEPAREPELRFVGRITGMVDCQWADASTEAAAGSFVPQGRKYALASGLLEITYDTGAKVILQGPCSYEVDAGDGGFLALGKLTAKVEKKVASDQRPVASEAATTRHSPLFTVRTPTSIVTDLGTEFAVEVDKSGASRAHVFRGTVEVRPGDRVRSSEPPILLGANQSASVAVGRDGVASVRRESGAPSPGAFARALPKRVRIKLFNTGVGLKEGDQDPHWQIVARSDDPNFKPRPAVVAPIIPQLAMSNDPDRSQWISAVGKMGLLPHQVTYTFRATFDLNGMLPNTAILRGRFMADDHVNAIRLNGHPLIVPEHRYGGSLFVFHEFRTTKGFVEGVNVLEVDIFNGGWEGIPPNTTGPIAFRMELEGSALPRWQAIQQQADATRSSDR